MKKRKVQLNFRQKKRKQKKLEHALARGDKECAHRLLARRSAAAAAPSSATHLVASARAIRGRARDRGVRKQVKGARRESKNEAKLLW